ncbi:NUDIX domain-containing protein [Rossellomorea marisflavi]|nr:NUDIX domain-containing protein [Rossellomorea marisflavi]
MSDYIREMRRLVGTRPLMVVGSTVLCINEKKELLLQYRTDADIWGLPGGVMEYGESVEETAAREFHEETGLLAGELQFIRILSGPDECHTYPNGDQIYGVCHSGVRDAYCHRDPRGQWRIPGAQVLRP